MPHYVYMLRCSGNRIYTGYATNPEKRYKKHQKGSAAKFTRAFTPLSILRIFECESKREALSLEAAIKKLPKIKKELLANGGELSLFIKHFSNRQNNKEGTGKESDKRLEPPI